MSEEATNSEEVLPEDETSLPESAEQSETQDNPETEGEEDGKPRKPTAKDRIDELTRLRREAERDAEYWKAKALQAPEAKPVEASAQPTAKEAPDPDNYDAGEFDTRYVRDLARWEAEQIVEERLAKADQENERKQAERQWRSRMDQASETMPDFEEKVIRGAEKQEWACSPVVGEALRASDKGPEIAYALASDPAEAARIYRLPPTLQLMEIGKLEAKLATPKPRTTTNAPSPAPTVRGSGGKFAVQPDTNDFAAFDKQYGNGS